MNRNVILCLAILTFAVRAAPARATESYPEFSAAYWQEEEQQARGKIWRGAALGVMGLASIAPTTVFAIKATDNPRKYLAYSIVSGIATLGMTFHGFFSISYGAEQRDKARRFQDRYAEDPASVDATEERDYYLYSEKKTTLKLMLFGGALIAQSAALLANGIVFSVRKKQGTDMGDIRIWPSYFIGGLLLPAGAFLVVSKGLRYRDLNRLASGNPSDGAAVSVRPYFFMDETFGAFNLGLTGRVTF